MLKGMRRSAARNAMAAIAVLGLASVVMVQSVQGIAQPAGAAPPADDPALLAALMRQGATVFSRNCASCHGMNGEGGVGPSFVESPHLASVVGTVEQIIFGGGHMPAFGHLSNGDIAAVATFIRNSFGNAYPLIGEAQVATYR